MTNRILTFLAAFAVTFAIGAYAVELTDERNRNVTTTLKAARANQPTAYLDEIATDDTDPTDAKTYVDEAVAGIDLAGKADTDLQNISDSLTDAEKMIVRTRIGAGTGGGTTLTDYLKSINAAGTITAVVGGTETGVSLRNALNLNGKLDKTIVEIPRVDHTSTMEAGERFKHPDFPNIYVLTSDVTGLNTGNFVANATRYRRINNPTNGEIVASINNSLGQTEWQMGGGDSGTTVTANPADNATAFLLKLGITDNVFEVGRATYLDTGSSPLVGGVTTPRFAGEIAVNNQGHVYPAVDKRIQHGSTDPSLTYGDFTPTDYYTGTSVPNRGDFYHAGVNEFIQNQTVPGGNDNFAQVHWADAWDYIVTNVPGGNTAEYRGYRDDWIWVGEHDTAQGAANAISHHADKADNSKTFVFSLRDHRVRQVLTFTDGEAIFVDNLTWGDVLTNPDDVRALISQYQSVREVNAGYQPTAEDYAAERLFKINDAIYRVLRSVPMDNAAEVGEWGVIASGTTIRYNGGTVDHRFRGIHHHDSDVGSPEEDDIYFVWGGRGAKVYSPAGRWLDRVVHSIQTTLGDGPWQGHYTTESEAVDHVSAAGDYVGVAYQLRRATSYTAATTTYTYSLQNIAGDVPRLTDADAEVLDFIHYITPQDTTLTVGVHGTGTARVYGYLPDDNIGGLDPDFSDVDSEIERIYYLQSDYSVESDLAGKICFERTEDEDATNLYGGLSFRTAPDGQDAIVYELEQDDYTDDDTRRYCTTQTIASGYHWDDGETHKINIQNPNFERSVLGTPWLWHRPFGGQEASEAELTLDAVKAFARATGQTGSRAIRGSDMDEDTVFERQLAFQNTNVDTDAGGYLPVKVRDAEGSGFVRTQIKNKDVEPGSLAAGVFNTAATARLLPAVTSTHNGRVAKVIAGNWAIGQEEQSDWNVTDTNSRAFIANKPTIRSLPDPSGATTGQVVKRQADGTWGIGDDEQGSGSGTTNLSTEQTAGEANVTIESSTGTNAPILPATATVPGVMSAADKTKLNGLAANRQLPSGGTANQVLVKDSATDYDVSWGDQTGGTGSTNLAIASRGTTTLQVTSSTGTNATVPAATQSLAGLLTSADKTKLDGLELQITMVPMANVTYNTADTADLSTRFGSGATAVTVNLDVAGNDDAEIDDLFVFQFRENLASIDDERQIGIRVNSSTALPIRIVDPVTQAFTNKRVENTTRYTFHFLTRQEGVFIELSPTMDLVGAVARLLPAASGGTDGQVAKISGGEWVIADDATSGGSGNTNLSIGTRTGTTMVVESSSGTNATLPAASTTQAGLLNSTDKTKLDALATARQLPNPVGATDGQIAKISSGAWVFADDETGGGSGSTDLGATYTANAVTVTSSSGDNATLTAASTTAAGVMTSADKTDVNNAYVESSWQGPQRRIAFEQGDGTVDTLVVPLSTFYGSTTNPVGSATFHAGDYARVNNVLYMFVPTDNAQDTKTIADIPTDSEFISIAAGAATNISVAYENANDRVEIESSTGSDDYINAASATAPGVMTSAQFTKLANFVGRGSGWRFVGAPNAPYGWAQNSLSINLDSSYDVEGQILILQWADTVGPGEGSAAMRLRLGNSGNYRAIEGRNRGSHLFEDLVGDDILEHAMYVLQRTSTKWRVLFVATTDGTTDLSNYLTTTQIDTRVQDTVSHEQTVWLPAAAWEGQSTAPPEYTRHTGSSDGPDSHSWSFDQTDVEKIQTTMNFPDNWNEGTIQYRVFWQKENTVTGTVVFGLRGLSAGDGDDITGAVYGSQINVQDANQDTLEVAISAWSGALTISGADADAVTYLELQRDADNGNDSLADDAHVIGVELRFTATGIDGA